MIDYGLGNVQAFLNTYKNLGIQAKSAKNDTDLKDASHIILPGVGSFDQAITQFKNSGMKREVEKMVLKDEIPILGVCVGMQILSEFGYENKKTKGLGLIKGSIKKINTKRVLPHVGFNSVIIENKTKLFSNIDELESEFYFTHSFELILKTNTTSFCMYHEKKIISSIEKDNIIGVQFHPENSRRQGIKLIDNFINKY